MPPMSTEQAEAARASVAIESATSREERPPSRALRHEVRTAMFSQKLDCYCLTER